MECVPCPLGKTTNGPGSNSSTDCSGPLIFDKFDYSTVPTNMSCQQLVEYYGINITVSEVVGDGLCNGGVFNTDICQYDGGDCCYQTCMPKDLDTLGGQNITVGDRVEWEIACTPWSFQCRDPAATDSSAACNVTGAPTEHTYRNRPCPVGAAARLGNGYCDAELNYAECDYDLGDCCMATCRYNGSIVGSCSKFTFDCRDPQTATPLRPYVVPPNAFFDCATVTDEALTIQGVVDRTYTSFDTPCQQARLSATPLPTTLPPSGSGCPTAHVVVRSWDIETVLDDGTNGTSTLEQRIYFYDTPVTIPPVCLLIDPLTYPSLGFSFGALTTSPDFALPDGLTSCTIGTPRNVFVACLDVVGDPSSTCIYNDDTDELYFDQRPSVGQYFILRQGVLDGCGELHVVQRFINVVDESDSTNIGIDLSTCHDARPVPGGQVLGERLPTTDVQTLTGLVCTQVVVTKTSKADTWQVGSLHRD